MAKRPNVFLYRENAKGRVIKVLRPVVDKRVRRLLNKGLSRHEIVMETGVPTHWVGRIAKEEKKAAAE